MAGPFVGRRQAPKVDLSGSFELGLGEETLKIESAEAPAACPRPSAGSMPDPRLHPGPGYAIPILLRLKILPQINPKRPRPDLGQPQIAAT